MALTEARSDVSLLTTVSVVLLTILAARMNKCVNGIVVPPELENYVEEFGFRDFIISEIEEYESRLRKVVRMTPCLSSFAETYLSLQPSRIPVLLPQNSSDHLEISQIYLSALQKIRSVYVFRDHLDPAWDHINTRSSLIILEDSWQISNMSFELIDLCGKDCRYLVVLIPTHRDKEAFLRESDRVCSFLWRQRVANVAILGVVEDEVLIAKSLSFKSNLITEPTSPVLVAECDENSSWSAAKVPAAAAAAAAANGSRSDIYLPLKMNRSIVNVAFFNYEPYVTSIGESPAPPLADESANRSSPDNDTGEFYFNESIRNRNGVEGGEEGTERNAAKSFVGPSSPGRLNISKLGGFEGLILNTLAARMNFVIIATQVERTAGGDPSNIDVNEILWAQDAEWIDMVIGGLIWSPSGETVYTLPYDVVQYIWLIPIRPNVSLHGLIAPLDKNVWFAVIGLLIFASSIELLIKRNVAFLEILSLVIGVAWPTQPNLVSSRIRFISWVIFGYVLTQCYLASLAGQLMASSDAQIETIRELAESSYQIGGTTITKDLFNITGETNIGDGREDDIDSADISRTISEKLLIFEHEEYKKSFDDLIATRNTSLALSVRMNVSSMTPSFQGKHVHRMKESLASYPLSFAVWRGIPYLNDLDDMISRLVEGGIVSYWAKNISRAEAGFYREQSENTEKNVNLLALVPGFLLLLIGYGLSVISLFVEVAIFGWRIQRSNGTKVGRRIVKKKLQQSISPKVEIDEKIMVPDPLDARAWILQFKERTDRYSQRKTVAFPQPPFPIEFLH